MNIGVDYYPEHWDRSLWAQDADLMAQTGVKLVRLAEFAWSRLEPEEGVYCFDWLDEAISLFRDRGIGVVLCTPTSCPPLWLYEKYPDSVMTEKDGTPTRLGIRGHRCINHPAVRRASEEIIVRMAKRYADDPAVVAWQVDNELEAYFCFCERCTEKFRTWLQKKHGTLQNLNRAYGNVVWSGEYSSWNQVQPPWGDYPHAWLNPAMMLDYSRFASDNVIDFAAWQAELLRTHCPGRPVTTNVWFCGHMPDFYREFVGLDFISYDNYPTTRLPDNPEEMYSHAFHLDMMRGVKRAPFWIMEQLSGGMGCWSPMARSPEPGMIGGYALQAFAHGADTVVFFRWRTANIGAEMHWHGLIDHSNVPGRRFREFADLCRVAEGLTDVQGMQNPAEVAILFAFDNEYAMKLQPQTNGYYYLEQLQRLHAAFTALGCNVDVIGQHAPLDGYRVVCAPEMYVTDEGVVQRLHDFAAQGGTVILTTRSGVKDENNNALMSPLPGPYRDMAGAYATEYDPIGYDSVNVRFADGTIAQGRQWCDVLALEGATAVAAFDGEYFRGAPAVTKNAFGRGHVYYLATVGSQGLYAHLAKLAAADASLDVLEGLPPRVEAVRRTDGRTTVRFLFNNDRQAAFFRLGEEEITLAPFEMKIDRFTKEDV